MKDSSLYLNILTNWFIVGIVILLTDSVLASVNVNGFGVALLVAVIVGILNTFVKPVLTVLTLPITILTFGLFTFVLNALLILLTAAIIPGFSVAGFWAALLFSIIVSILLWGVRVIFRNV